jgi:hypothetical protein
MQTATGKVTAYKDLKLPVAPEVPYGPEWVRGLTAITPEDAEILLAAIRALYPHDGLNLRIYRRVILHFNRLAAASSAAANTFRDFSKFVGETWPIAFDNLPAPYRHQALKRIEATPEFFFVQRAAVRFLYDDVEVWAAFGYEGASVHLGGYIKRGFDDLDWLPALPNDI